MQYFGFITFYIRNGLKFDCLKKYITLTDKIMIRKCIIAGLALTLSATAFSQSSPEMISVEGGTFTMGNDYSFSAGDGVADESPEHKVTVSSFYMSKTEITFELFDLFCEATGYMKPEDGKFGRGKLPVCNVSWQSACMFCNWLSMRDGFDRCYSIKRDSSNVTIKLISGANGYRLPTEAEWEYAARGGKDAKIFSYSGSNDYNEVAWCRNNTSTPHPVATKLPNALGLYDMSGNAWEWCWDLYGKAYYKDSPADNPMGPASGSDRVYRGGNFRCNLDYLRLTGRYHAQENKDYGMIGFRVAKNN